MWTNADFISEKWQLTTIKPLQLSPPITFLYDVVLNVTYVHLLPSAAFCKQVQIHIQIM